MSFEDDSGLFSLELDDGSTAIYDASGDVIEMYDAAGEDMGVTPGEYEIDFDALAAGDSLPDETEQLDMIEQRLAAAEQRVQEPLVVRHELRQPDHLADVDDIGAQLDEQARDLELSLGRAFTLDERRAIGTLAIDRLRETGVLDMETAMGLADWRGEINDGRGLGDMDNDHDRQRHMAQRLLDSERQQAQDRGEDDVTRATPPPTRETYDLDDDQQRQAWMTETLQGRFETDQEL